MSPTISSITETIKDRLDELPPGEEYDHLLAALDALDPPGAEDAPPPEGFAHEGSAR